MGNTKTTFQIFLISLIGTFVFDLILTHTIQFQNMPDFLAYFIAIKFIPSFIIMLVVYNIFEKRYDKKIAWLAGIPIALLIFVAFVQTYYGIYPIPMSNGVAVKLTLEQSFVGGYIPHLIDFLLAFGIVSLIFRKWK